MAYDYGRCHVCGGRMEERLTSQGFEEEGEWVLIRSVPTGVCTRCGEKVFRGNLLERLEQIRQERKLRQPEVRIEVPVFAF